MQKYLSFSLAICAGVIFANGADYTIHTFKKIQLTDQFWCEGAYYGDFNKDGKMDICGGPFWWEGPDFKIRHEFRPATKTSKIKKPDGTEVTIPGYKGALGNENDYSDDFLTFVYDFNKDGWDDIMIYDIPGTPVYWYENPKGQKNQDGTEHWKRHKVFDVLDNESPNFVDITGDGVPEILCNSKGYIGYAEINKADPTQPWLWHAISPKGTWHKYTHGIGYGDLNGDGRTDILEAEGWWEQPASLAADPIWKNHPYPFAPKTGAAQMFAYDFNGDGLNDVLTTLAPHNYGIAWYEQTRKADGSIDFIKHLIVGNKPEDNKYGVKFSQAHAFDLVDIDGDGIKDFVTGKRFWAHGPTGDDEPNAPAVLYWFKTVRNADRSVDFIPYLIDNDSGVGTQVVAADINGDKLPDVIVGNKKGVFVFIHQIKKVSKEEWEKAQPKPINK
ncbi:MAG: FG-GAP repeat domain-containing protein [Limisphaerales bacterium]